MKFWTKLCVILISLVLMESCRKDDAVLKSAGTLGFSKDTVFFDTVFTRLPNTAYPRSINKRFMIRNPYKETVFVNARVMGGSASSYRFNVDGRFGKEIADIEILPKDSAWVFVECTLEPNQLTQPALVRDSIEFETNGNRQYVQLAAYGWDAYYFNDTLFEQDVTLTKTDKPYVIVNTCFVDEGVTMTIGPGVHIYSTANSVFVSNPNRIINVSAINVLGTLKVNGTADNPVIFEGDRLDVKFKDLPGQWRGIRFFRGSVNNEIRHSVIKNATIGVWVDSLSENTQENLKIYNTIIKNISAYGVLGLTAQIYMENSVVANCGANTVLGYWGGYYTFRHCTFYAGGGRRDPHLIFNNQLRNDKNEVTRTFPIGYAFLNSIIWGPNQTEIGFDISTTVVPDFAVFRSSIIRSKTAFGGNDLLFNTDPLFKQIGTSDFKLNAGSPAINKANVNFSVSADLDGKVRDSEPDIGAYEF
jgi:hypothetical protein